MFHHPYEINEYIGELKLSVSHNDLGRETEPCLWSSGWHIHSECEIIAVLDGCERVVADKPYELSAGDVLVVPKRLEHKCIPKSDRQVKVSLLVGAILKRNDLGSESTEARIFEVLDEFANKLSSPLHLSGRADLTRYVSDAVAMACSKNRIAQTTFKYQLVTFVLRVLESLGETYDFKLVAHKSEADETRSRGDSLNARNQMVERYIYTTELGELSVKGLSEYVHLSERQLSRVVLENYGATFKQVVNQRRIKTAQTLLGEGMAVETVARRVGFESVNGFNKAFKTLVGITPYQYSRRLEFKRRADS